MRTALLAPGLMLAVPATRAADTDGVPFWVSLRNGETNMRVGPGRDYRINWTYKRPGLPMKVLRSMEGWVLVEDPDGARGWMLTQFVTHKAHTALVHGAVAEIRENRDGSGRVMWRAQPGAIARLLGECSSGWCKVDIDGRQGFMAATSLWGAGAP
ncbi:SH3 domain-containing protein [Novosphingobium sp.]|uniref:SH3 domain-containing protein n=1 Tax=Novosphingobium sp. TaxID=1874826 RepID=UPI00333F3B78